MFLSFSDFGEEDGSDEVLFDVNPADWKLSLRPSVRSVIASFVVS